MQHSPLRTGAGTDPGRQRTGNEDAYLCLPEAGIFAVIDGVGGYAGGEVAAAVAREAVSRRLAHRHGEPEEERLREAVTNANNTIYWRSREEPDLAGMACVLTVVLVEGPRLFAAHVGDTRLYKIRQHKIVKLTSDHSFVGVQEDRDELSEYEAMHHPRRNEILRDVGSELHEPNDDNFIDIVDTPFEPEAALLLCTDGLTDLVPSRELLRLVYEHAGHPQAAAEALIRAANDAGGTDNITVVVVEGSRFGAPDTPPPADNAADTGRTATGGADARPAHAPDAPAQQHAAARNVLPDLAAGDGQASQPAALPPRALWRFFFYGVGTVLTLLAAAFLLVKFWPGDLTFRPRAPEPSPAAPADGAAPPTLGALLAQAVPGQTVTVPPGTYREAVRLREGVTLQSEQPGGARIVPPADSVAVRAENVAGAALVGFYVGPDTAAGAGSLAVGILVRNAGVRLEGLTVTGTTRAGVDIATDTTLAVVLRDSDISGNAGAGVVARGTGGSVRITGNRIEANGGAGLVLLPAAAVDVHGNTFGGNGAGGVELRLDADSARARLRRTNTFAPGSAAGDDVRVVIRNQRDP